MAKFNPETTGKILEALKTTGLVRAAELAGITRETLRTWQRQGEADQLEGKATKYSDFVQQVVKVQANRYAILESSVLIAATKDRDWRAAAWYLERTKPKEFGPKNFTEVQISGALQGLLEAVEPHMSRESYAELLNAISKIEGGDAMASMESEAAGQIIQ